MEKLSDLIHKGAGAEAIAQLLDAMDEATRVAEVRAIGGGDQAKLWELAEGRAAPLDVFAPSSETDRTIIYAGRNSLPAFRIFEKRFWRRGDGKGVLGYNEQTMQPFTGPGYFTVRDGDGGEMVFDYTSLPDLQPPGWPALAPNKGVIAGAVYGHMIDYNRRLSRDTYIGRASKKGKLMEAYYLLTRVTSSK